MVDLSTVIKAMQGIGSVALQLPAVAQLVEHAIGGLKTEDQATAKEAYNDLIADNADGHARVQAKLAELAKQG